MGEIRIGQTQPRRSRAQASRSVLAASIDGYLKTPAENPEPAAGSNEERHEAAVHVPTALAGPAAILASPLPIEISERACASAPSGWNPCFNQAAS